MRAHLQVPEDSWGIISDSVFKIFEVPVIERGQIPSAPCKSWREFRRGPEWGWERITRFVCRFPKVPNSMNRLRHEETQWPRGSRLGYGRGFLRKISDLATSRTNETYSLEPFLSSPFYRATHQQPRDQRLSQPPWFGFTSSLTVDVSVLYFSHRNLRTRADLHMIFLCHNMVGPLPRQIGELSVHHRFTNSLELGILWKYSEPCMCALLFPNHLMKLGISLNLEPLKHSSLHHVQVMRKALDKG